MAQHRYVYRLYCILKGDSGNGKSNWVSSVKVLLYQCGCKYVWVSQSIGNEQVFIYLFKQRLYDILGKTRVIASLTSHEALTILV